MKQNQQGFTLIELVVVMVILGVLAATALPKFMNVNNQAHTAAVAGVGGSFGTAISLVKAQWVANGIVGADTDGVEGYGNDDINTDENGWAAIPGAGAGAGAEGDGDGDGAAAIATATAGCKSLWEELMTNPPLVDTAENPKEGAAYTAIYGTIAGTQPAIKGCTYTYKADSKKNIQYYDDKSGTFLVTNPE